MGCSDVQWGSVRGSELQWGSVRGSGGAVSFSERQWGVLGA